MKPKKKETLEEWVKETVDEACKIRGIGVDDTQGRAAIETRIRELQAKAPEWRNQVKAATAKARATRKTALTEFRKHEREALKTKTTDELTEEILNLKEEIIWLRERLSEVCEAVDKAHDVVSEAHEELFNHEKFGRDEQGQRWDEPMHPDNVDYEAGQDIETAKQG
jgi:ribosomal protein L29